MWRCSHLLRCCWGVYYFASGIATEGSRVVLAMQPFGEPGAVQQYTLLSSAHLLDVLNMVLLAAGPGLFALPLLRKVTWTRLCWWRSRTRCSLCFC